MRRGVRAETLSWSERVPTLLRGCCQALIIFNGIALAAFPTVIRDGWWNDSPLLNVLGAGTGLLLLVICWLAGGVWWCITGSQDLAKWSAQAMPWFGQPERSVLGILAAFVLLALVAGWVFSRVRFLRVIVLPLNMVLVCTCIAAYVFLFLIEHGIV
jgi:hypothetical protein